MPKPVRTVQYNRGCEEMTFPTILSGSSIQLLPLELSCAEGLFACGTDSRIWTYLPNKVETREDMDQMIQSALESQRQGTDHPYAVYSSDLGKLVGSTRFLNISIPNKQLEIGWTWYTPEVWRTRVNTECKYTLLKYSFEEFKAVRVQFKADIRNDRSNRAIERIGAVREGMLRQDRILHDGYIRNSYLYSIIDTEWPAVKERLEQYLNID